MFTFQCVNLGVGLLFGEEDAVNLINHTKTVKCATQRGDVLVMSNSDFF